MSPGLKKFKEEMISMGKFVKAALVLSLLASAMTGSFTQTAAAAEEKQYVMLYSSLKDSQLAAIREGFMKKHPNTTTPPAPAT